MDNHSIGGRMNFPSEYYKHIMQISNPDDLYDSYYVRMKCLVCGEMIITEFRYSKENRFSLSLINQIEKIFSYAYGEHMLRHWQQVRDMEEVPMEMMSLEAANHHQYGNMKLRDRIINVFAPGRYKKKRNK